MHRGIRRGEPAWEVDSDGIAGARGRSRKRRQAVRHWRVELRNKEAWFLKARLGGCAAVGWGSKSRRASVSAPGRAALPPPAAWRRAENPDCRHGAPFPL